MTGADGVAGGAVDPGDTDGMTAEEKRRDQLLRAEGSTEADAAPRIVVSDHDGVTRIDIADDAVVRPGDGPGMDESETAP